MEWLESLGYIGLFVASFLAATVLPFSSEVTFTALVLGGLNPWTCVYVATLGNWLGGLTCYWLGHLGKMQWVERFLRVKKEKVEHFATFIQKYGDWVAFFSFLPGVGDIVAIAAGFFRCRLWVVAVSMLMGKFVRYLVWMYFQGLLFA